jgi:hypothetical protein
VPRYYFDIRDGESFIQDDDGVDLSGIQEAKEQASRALADMARDAIPGLDVYEMAIEVSDEAKNPLLRTMFRFEVQRLG